jgi:hypothetical protein
MAGKGKKNLFVPQDFANKQISKTKMIFNSDTGQNGDPLPTHLLYPSAGYLLSDI